METCWHIDYVDPETHGIETICVTAADEDDARDQAPCDARVLDVFPDAECAEVVDLRGSKRQAPQRHAA